MMRVATAGLARRLRLLPLTIVAMALLLVVKSVVVVRAAIPSSAEVRATVNVASAAPAAVPPTVSVSLPAPSPAPRLPAGPATSSLVATARATAPVEQVSDSERGLLLDLRRRRAELELQEAALSVREAVLSGAERRLFIRVDELTALQARLEALEAGRREHDEANWRGLVKLYEAMRPRDAAAIFNDLDKAVLLAVLDRMKEAKAAPVLAAMLPERARQATTELAQLRNLATKAPAAP